MEKKVFEVYGEIGLRDRKFREAMKRTEKSFNTLRERIFNLKTAIVGLAGAYGLGKLAGSFLDAARATSQYSVRLKVILKSQEIEILWKWRLL